MNIFNWFKKKPKKEEKLPKEFTFEILKGHKIGERYVYTIPAKNREEAFIKLVKYFYGEEMNQEVKSKHFEVSWPAHEVFCTDMPLWFAKTISGYRREGKNNYDEMLKEFAEKNGIKLKSDRL